MRHQAVPSMEHNGSILDTSLLLALPLPWHVIPGKRSEVLSVSCFPGRLLQLIPLGSSQGGEGAAKSQPGHKEHPKRKNQPNTSALLGTGWAGCHYPPGLVIFRSGVTMK